jgi:ferrous iron transport protein A
MKLEMNSTFTDANSAVLSELQEGATGVLAKLDLAPRLSEHLMNLGFIPGVEVLVARSGPGGDPRIYRVEGTDVALRAELARKIIVRRILRQTES